MKLDHSQQKVPGDVSRRCAAIVLAAGKGTRMKSSIPKVCHELLGRPLIWYPLNLLFNKLYISKCNVVVGHGAKKVMDSLSDFDVSVSIQEEQLGTAHAVSCALPSLSDHNGPVLIMCGDMPLLRAKTLYHLIEYHVQNENAVSVLTAHVEDPTGYGRIIRDPSGARDNGDFVGIVEEKDASPDQRAINEINTGTYVVNKMILVDLLHEVDNSNAQGEYYLTDIVKVACTRGLKVGALASASTEEAIGVNSRMDLSMAEGILLNRYRSMFMAQGVTLLMAHTVYIETGVEIGRDVVIEPFVCLMGKTYVESGARIGAYSMLRDAHVGPGECVPPFSKRIGRG